MAATARRLLPFRLVRAVDVDFGVRNRGFSARVAAAPYYAGSGRSAERRMQESVRWDAENALFCAEISPISSI